MTDPSQKKISESLTVTRKLPVNFIQADEFIFFSDLKKELPSVIVYFLNDICVTPDGILFKGLSVLKQFLIWPAHTKEFNTIYLIKNFLKRKRKKTDPNTTYIICFDYWSCGYFHWICDFLPRLLMVQDELKNTTLLLPQNHNATYVEPCLKAMGVNTILRFNMNEYLQCSRAIIPGYVTNSGDHRPEIMRTLRDKIFEHCYTKNNTIYSENIYISRSRTKGRFIQNEKEIERVLLEKGFKIIHFEDHSFSEQIAIAHHAKNYIGLHGANLTNLIFMKPNTNILELRREDDKESNYYFSLSSTFNIHYYYQKCSYNYDGNNRNYNLIVDLPVFEKNISSMLAQTN